MSAPGAPGAQQPAVPPDSARVAIDQRIIIGSLVLVLVAIGLDMGLATNSASRAASIALDIAALVVSIVGVGRLASALRLQALVTIVSIVLLFVPFLNLAVLGWFNAKAMKVLRAAGWRVGFLGASRP